MNDPYVLTGELIASAARLCYAEDTENACETKILMTMNARVLLHFFEERLCLCAQWEIRDE